MQDVIIIGAGIIGATVTRALRKLGRDVMLLDDKRPFSGTAPSGGHLKPSWFSGIKKNVYEPAMELLDDVWGLHEEQFTIWPTGLTTTVFRVDTDQVIKVAHTRATVKSIDTNYQVPSVTLTTGEIHQCQLLIIAAGAWCRDLLSDCAPIQQKRGVSFRMSHSLDHPFIKPWAPYKQVVAHQQSQNEIWIGDGSTILDSNWTEERTKQCLTRCQSAVPGAILLRSITGIRPYCIHDKSDPCLIKSLSEKVWLATGAGKSGTIAAGVVARRIIDATS